MARKPIKGSEPQWPAYNVERRPITELRPYEKNPRTHSASQTTQIAASMLEFGWTFPVLIDEKGELIAGHGRIQAAFMLVTGGFELGGSIQPPRPEFTEAPCIVAKGWTEAQKRAYVIADNKLTLNGGWDEDLLKVELAELKDFGFDLALTGFADDELNLIFHGWSSDIDLIDKHGENLDGILATLKVKVDQEATEIAKAAIIKALDENGLKYELV
jgi:ParB-like chromosome segregation protein Spo0J